MTGFPIWAIIRYKMVNDQLKETYDVICIQNHYLDVNFFIFSVMYEPYSMAKKSLYFEQCWPKIIAEWVFTFDMFSVFWRKSFLNIYNIR